MVTALNPARRQATTRGHNRKSGEIHVNNTINKFHNNNNNNNNNNDNDNDNNDDDNDDDNGIVDNRLNQPKGGHGNNVQDDLAC